jgi:RNA recognition motif-containing protein
MKLGETYNEKEVRMQSNKLYVGNLSYSVTDKQLEELFSQYGQIKEVTIIGSKGFGFVEMSDTAEAEKAKEALDGTSFEGRTLKVDEARPRKERTDNNYRRY